MALLPAEPPLIHNHPFVALWNAPTHRCRQLDIPLDTAAFQAVTTPAAVSGQFLTIFYEGRLGLYPKVDTTKRKLYRGGVPQNANLKKHLAVARIQIDRYISQDSSPGLAVIDWESWRPLWDQNWGLKRIYQNLSINHALQTAPHLSSKNITKLAKRQFQQAGRRFMKRTISLGIGERPSRRWGFYLFPNCYNYNWVMPGYTGKCSKKTQRQNNQMLWLWERSTTLFPSIYLHQSMRNSPKAKLFVRNRVQEALRVATLPKCPYMMPVYVYSRPVYRDMTQKFQSWAACQSLSDYLTSTLNPYIANVTAAAMLCSEVLCQGKGLCIRKSYDSTNYLPLNRLNFTILRPDGRYVAIGRPSAADLQAWAQHFTCHCYAGQSCSPKPVLPTSIKIIRV